MVRRVEARVPFDRVPTRALVDAELRATAARALIARTRTGDGGPVKGMCVNYAVGDIAGAQRVFGALADGGEVIMPRAETFWSPRVGMCVDRFGIPWMVNAEAPASGS